MDEDCTEGIIETRLWHPKYPSSGEEPKTIAVFPFLSNSRMVVQRSSFTLSGDSFQPLEEQFQGRLSHEGCIKKLILPPESYNDAQNFLDLAGISSFSYFPDFEGLRMKFEERQERTIHDIQCWHPP